MQVYDTYCEFQMKRERGAASHDSGNRSQRQLRVGEVLRHALAEVLGRDGLRDPDLIGVVVTVTEVRVSADLRSATAFVMPLGGGDCAKVVEALGRAARFLRHSIAGLVTLRHLPAITFEADGSFEYAGRIDQLLRTARDDDAAAEDPEGKQDDGA